MLKIKAILLLFIFCLSSVANAVEIHYCEGEITAISFIGNAVCNDHEALENTPSDSCHATTMDCCQAKEKPVSDANLAKDKTCCKTANLSIDQTVVAQEAELELVQIAMLVAHYNILTGTNIAAESNHQLPLDPIIKRPSAQILFQSFLI